MRKTDKFVEFVRPTTSRYRKVVERVNVGLMQLDRRIADFDPGIYPGEEIDNLIIQAKRLVLSPIESWAVNLSQLDWGENREKAREIWSASDLTIYTGWVYNSPVSGFQEGVHLIFSRERNLAVIWRKQLP